VEKAALALEPIQRILKDALPAAWSSPKRTSMSSRNLALSAGARRLLGLGLVWCARYASTSTGAAGPQADLPAIDVQEPLARREQVFATRCSFWLTGGADSASARYGLLYRMRVREQEIAVERGAGTPNLYQLTGGVSFLLKDVASGESLFGASVTSLDTYTRSSQNFANIRAERDAEDRLAKALAELTQARLAAYFATHR
jgi:LPS-assembly lipoprotein